MTEFRYELAACLLAVATIVVVDGYSYFRQRSAKHVQHR